MRNVSILAAAALLLSACVQYPIFEKNVEGSLPEKAVPKFIEVGKTHREDVRSRLGKPDGWAGDESWYTYGYKHNRGGSGYESYAAGPPPFGAITIDYGRLILRFDAAGLVQSVKLEEKSCPYFLAVHGAPQGEPCLDVRGNDLYGTVEEPK